MAEEIRRRRLLAIAALGAALHFGASAPR